jgi:DNA-binding CsgD family transcriptional regulator
MMQCASLSLSPSANLAVFVLFCWKKRAMHGLKSRLVSAGLTLREAEVLLWMMCGKTDSEIGVILGSRTKTVSKHLEHIYEKLGVENRTAAANAASELFASTYRL